jgi:phosphoribosylaminoimidazole carboxylase PurE protein
MIAVVMGSHNDVSVMKPAFDVLEEFKVPWEHHVLSAHRTPDKMMNYAKKAKSRGIKIIIAGAGGAAHLPGMMAAFSGLPVLGVPISSPLGQLSGLAPLLSIVQMPDDVPVATFSINGAFNAAIFALQMLAISDEELQARLQESLARRKGDDT